MGKVTRKKPTPAIPADLREAILRFVREEYLTVWLRTPNKLLGGDKPEDVLNSGEESRIWKALKLAQAGEGS